MKVLHPFLHVLKLKNFALQFEKLWPQLWLAARLHRGALHFEWAFHFLLKALTLTFLFTDFFVCFLRKKNVYSSIIKKKKFKRQKKKEEDLKDAFYLWERSSIWPCSCFLFLSWIKERGSQENRVPSQTKTNPCSFLQEKRKPPSFSTDTMYCSVKEFSLPKKKKKTKKRFKLEFDVLLQMLSFY